MDFFGHQEQARRNTRRLAVLFALAVILTIGVIYLALAAIFLRPRSGQIEGPGWLWNTKFFLGVAGGTVAVVAAGSLLKINELSCGGSGLAMKLGGSQVDPGTTDPDKRKLMNVVEEMAIASGIPVPAVFVLEEQKGVNAFAAGHSTSDAAIGVTKGAVKVLTRDELQGVIAHEFSHVLNGDMRLNMRLIGILYGILCLTIIGRILLRTRGRKNPGPLIGLVLIVVGSIGFFFGRLIKAAVSRQREFLADAAAVQFTRNPDGLAGALKKIGGAAFGSRVDAGYAEEASHLFFGNAVGRPWLNLWATHPPLRERIRRIDPGWDGKFLRVEPPPEPVELPGRSSARTRDFAKILATPGGAAAITAAGSLDQIGAPTVVHLDYARELLASLPDEIRTAAHLSSGAEALVYALLLGGDEAIRRQQLQGLEARLGEEVQRHVKGLVDSVAALGRDAKLPLLELALPALRRLSAGEYAQFRATLQFLIEFDREIDLFEYCLQKALLRHLEPHFGGSRKPVVQFHALKPVIPDCAVVLSALSRLGHESAEEEERAFRAGVQRLNLPAGPIRLLPLEQCNLPQIDQALGKLAQLSPPLKKLVLSACAHAVAADGEIERREAELLRAIADALDCPMPPFVQTVSSSPS